jgi:carnitine O-acetyltransferase
VAVLCKNQFYYFQALWPNTYEVAVDEYDILDILKAIQKHADALDPVEGSKFALGVLTSLPRTQWAVTRNELCETEVNATALHVIDSALFVLVLDDYEETDINDAASNMLHGKKLYDFAVWFRIFPSTMGVTNAKNVSSLFIRSTFSSAILPGASVLKNDEEGNFYQAGTCLNRWYDKLQIIVCRKGTAGINFEHSSIDGHTALRFVSDVFAETVITFAESIVDPIHGRNTIAHVVEADVKRAALHTDANGRPSLDVFPKKLVFELPDSVKERIYYAETSLCDDLSSNDTVVLEFRDYGKTLIVGNKMSPDSYVQMSMMLAYYKLYGKVVCTYEPVLTKSFYHGRTEAMRSATTQARDLCMMWCNKSATPLAKLEALHTATKEHSRLVKESATGNGVDRHLFALKCLSQRISMPLPDFFQSKAWETLNHTVLSTSNCGNPSLRLFGFGPTVPDGFGIGYIIKDNGLQYSVSSKHRQNKRYVETLRSTLKEMQNLLKPISSVEVGAHRPSLKGIKVVPSRQSSSSYGDLWGETDMVQALKQEALEPEPASLEHGKKPRRASRFFSGVIPKVIPERVSLTLRG